jgi:hypothetical protein
MRLAVLSSLCLVACNGTSKPPEAFDASAGVSSVDGGRTHPAPNSATDRICTAGSTFMFQYVWQLQGGATGFGQSVVLLRNGASYLRIDGDCNYWALRGRDRAPIRRGTLTDVQEQSLIADLRFYNWPGWYGSVIGTTTFDAAAQVFVTPQGEFTCFDLCGTPESESDAALAAERRPVFLEAERVLDDLYQRGTPLDGPVRILGKTSTLAREYWDLRALSAWTGSIALANLVFDDPLSIPPGGVLVEGDDARYLRRLRQEADERYNAGLGTYSGLVGIDDGARIIELLIADVLPGEDETGVIPRSVGPSRDAEPPAK